MEKTLWQKEEIVHQEHFLPFATMFSERRADNW